MTEQNPSAEIAAGIEPTATDDHESLTQYGARMALRYSWIAGIVSALLVLVLNGGRNPIPMLEDARSFGMILLFFMVPTAFVTTLFTFVMGINALNKRLPDYRQRGWKIAVVPIGIAYALLMGLIVVVALQLAEPAFPFLALDNLQAAFLVGLTSAALTYWLVTQTTNVTSSGLLQLTIIVVAAGVYLAMSSSDDPLWWTISLSSMGTHGTFVSWIFNTSLVFAGLMMLVWTPFFMTDLDALVRHGLTTEDGAKRTRYGLIALAIAVGLVGAFENGVSQLTDNIHNLSAPLMGVIVIILAVSLRRLVPGLPREVYATSFALAALLVVGVIFVMIGYFNTAGITIYGSAIAFTWLTLFVSTVEQEANEFEPPPA